MFSCYYSSLSTMVNFYILSIYLLYLAPLKSLLYLGVFIGNQPTRMCIDKSMKIRSACIQVSEACGQKNSVYKSVQNIRAVLWAQGRVSSDEKMKFQILNKKLTMHNLYENSVIWELDVAALCDHFNLDQLGLASISINYCYRNMTIHIVQQLKYSIVAFARDQLSSRMNR